MAKKAPLFDELEELALKLKLPKYGDYYDWYALPWEVFSTWFKWKDDTTEKRLYLVYDPPIEKGLSINYAVKFQLYYQFGKEPPKSELNINGNVVDQCSFGLLIGGMFNCLLKTPKKGVFVNLIDLEWFKTSPYKAILKKGAIPFYIDYSQTQIVETVDCDLLEKLRKLKALSERGIGGEMENAKVLLAELLKKHKLTIADL